MESKPEEIEKEKYQQFRKDIKDESAFTEKLNNLYYTEFEEIFQDLLLFPEEEIISSLTTGVRMILSDSYTEDIFQNKTLTSLLDKAKNKVLDDEIYINGSGDNKRLIWPESVNDLKSSQNF